MVTDYRLWRNIHIYTNSRLSQWLAMTYKWPGHSSSSSYNSSSRSIFITISIFNTIIIELILLINPKKISTIDVFNVIIIRSPFHFISFHYELFTYLFMYIYTFIYTLFLDIKLLYTSELIYTVHYHHEYKVYMVLMHEEWASVSQRHLWGHCTPTHWAREKKNLLTI